MTEQEWDLENVYDEQVAPLMTEILRICKEHDLPMVASFEFAPGDFCTSAVQNSASSARIDRAVGILRFGLTPNDEPAVDRIRAAASLS